MHGGQESYRNSCGPVTIDTSGKTVFTGSGRFVFDGVSYHRLVLVYRPTRASLAASSMCRDRLDATKTGQPGAFEAEHPISPFPLREGA